MPAKRVLLVDDDRLAILALHALIDDDADLSVAGEARNAHQGIHLVETLRPHIVLIDINLPGMNGIEATRLIKKISPHTCVLILTSSDDADLLLDALRAGAAGYVLKTSSLSEIHTSIWEALRGELPVQQSVAVRALLQFAQRPAVPALSTLRDLTPREQQVLALLADGKTNPQIADILIITLHTVKDHVEHILAKLGVSDRTQAALRGIELGYIRRGELAGAR